MQGRRRDQDSGRTPRRKHPSSDPFKRTYMILTADLFFKNQRIKVDQRREENALRGKEIDHGECLQIHF